MKYIFRAYEKDADDFIYSDRDYDGAAWFEFRDGLLKAFVIHEKDYGPPEDRTDVVELEPPEMWTGQKDKFGNSIFGGDIADIHSKYDGVYRAEIIFVDGTFTIDPWNAVQVENTDGWKCPHDIVKSRGFLIGWGRQETSMEHNPKSLNRYEILHIEIVGNTRQNPELLEDNDVR